MKKLWLLTLLLFSQIVLDNSFLQAQTNDSIPPVDYSTPKEFEIGGIRVTGAQFSDDNAIISLTGLKVGEKIRVPGPDIQRAMRALWKLRLFTDVQIYKEKSVGEVIFLEIAVQERPRYTEHSFKGVKKNKHDDLNDIVQQHLLKGSIVTEYAKVNVSNGIKTYFREKGFLDTEIKVTEEKDPKRINAVRLVFNIDRNKKVKIQDITFDGNTVIKDRKLRKMMKGTRRKRRLFSGSKLIKPDYEDDKQAIVSYYNTVGFKDARIIQDSVWREDDGDLMIHLDLYEGPRYYFRNIAFKGNSIYKTDVLDNILGIKKGDIYNQELLETRLRFSPDGRDVSTVYMDNGYLFFRVDPVETAIIGDSIDLEIRIYEGPQATIDRVTIRGNDRTHEHVVRRELRTRPGQKFSRTDIIRSQREIVNLGYFNPEAMEINTPVNPQRGTVDIEYVLEEKPSDQLELSAGWAGGGRGIIGTLGVSFNNFSLRNFFKKESWSPLPQGDGQRLSLRAQTNGSRFQSYNVSFTEPWLGGKKPTSLSVGGFYNILSNGVPRSVDGHRGFNILGGSVGVGFRMKVPDDFFISNTTLNLQRLDLNEWQGFELQDGTNISSGDFFNFSINQTFTRTNVSDPIYPRSGSKFSLSMQFTPPYSLVKKNDFFKLSDDEASIIRDIEGENADVVINNLEAQNRFKWLEYHKWRFNFEWYTPLEPSQKLVLKLGGKIGMLGSYSDNIGLSPFEQFQLGGDGFSQQTGSFYNGIDIISMRGYEINELDANIGQNGGVIAAPVFDKFNIELRYPFSLNPSATIYILAFAEGGNAWRRFRDFNPFDVKRSAGMGLRVFLPMFGTLGFDYGLGFDKNAPENGSVFSRFGTFNIILGFEPE
ncbi:MAG: outer membrane protein assembly factor [Saprospiraceae bacterium]